MSWWTQFRTRVVVEKSDSFETKDQIRSEIEQIFGKQCTYDSPRETWDDMWNNRDAYLPSGSEGTGVIEIHNGHYDEDDARHSVWVIDIHGNLRDMYDNQETEDWFNKSMRKLNETDRKMRYYSFYSESECETVCRKYRTWRRIIVTK